MEKLIKKLSDNKITVSTCESCTGGLLAAEFVKVSGASDVFMEGAVTYSNDAKMRLGVKEETLKVHGAVSEETALQMANCIKERSGTMLGISTTGIAGPGGGTEEKPVGLVYIGVNDKLGTEVFRFVQHGDRERVRNKSALCALDIILKRIR